MRAPLQLAAGLLFTGSAGFVDAVGFIKLGGAFASVMGGNTTRFGVGLADSPLAEPWLPLALIAVFFAGCVAANLVLEADHRWGDAIVLAAMVLALTGAIGLAAAGTPPHLALLLLAAATGGQNVLLPRLGSLKLGISYVTGVLVSGGKALAQALIGRASPWEWSVHLLVWASLWVGALLGAWLVLHAGLLALVVPAAVYFGYMVRFALRPVPADNPDSR